MKTPEQVRTDITGRLSRNWSQAIGGGTPSPWPHSVTLGVPSRSELERQFAHYQQGALGWRRWHRDHAHLGVELVETARRVHGTTQTLPAKLRVPDIDAAAGLAGGDWPARLARARARTAVLAAQFPALADPARVLRRVDGWADVDFDLLCAAAGWFATNDGTGLTPRQVPIPGMHAKWLNTRQALVAELVGLEQLPLAPAHPARIHVTYLDPGHRAARGRRHDCISVGDTVTLPYRPAIVVISENKDTAVAFPPVPGGVAVEGEGFGGATAATMDWLTGAPVLAYWGDIDAAGFEILDGFRAAGVPAASMLMDRVTFDTYERFGTDVDEQGNPIPPGNRRYLPNLTDAERAMYHALTDPTWPGHRRLEQERIPLIDAEAALSRVETGHSALRPSRRAEP